MNRGVSVYDELEHYGRLGMKWGQHIFGREKTYNRSIKKLRKLDRKVQQKQYKAAKYGVKAAKKEAKSYTAWTQKGRAKAQSKYLKLNQKSAKLNFKSVKLSQKARKWVDSMNDVFYDMRLSDVSPEDIALGREYAVKAIEDYLNRH